MVSKKFGIELWRQVDGMLIRSGRTGFDLPQLVAQCQELADLIEAEPLRQNELGYAFAQQVIGELRRQPQYGSPNFGPKELADVIRQTVEHEMED